MIEAIIGAVIALIVAVAAFFNRRGKKMERLNAKTRALQDKDRRVKKGRDNVIESRDGRTADERVRDNDSRW